MDFIKRLGLALATTAAVASAAPTTREESERREPNMVTFFGERPAFHPNSSSFAYLSKSYGDVFSYDIETGHSTLITASPSAGYLRAQYLIDGNLILLGPSEFTDAAETREKDIEMWLLPAGSIEPISLHHKIWEGVAISYDSNKISWGNSHGQYPEWIDEDETVVFEAEIAYNETGYPSLANKREIMRSYAPECQSEPQDYRHNDTELIYTCYRITPESRVADVRGINIETGEVTVYRNVTKEYNEVEGIYPGGEYTTVESAHDAENPDDNYAIEIYRMKLQPDSQDFVRLTWYVLTDIPPDQFVKPLR